jgi:hypothetical protein
VKFIVLANTISSFIYGRKDWVSRMNGVWFGGILLELEGTLVINAGQTLIHILVLYLKPTVT